jgi:hypothetical protein
LVSHSNLNVAHAEIRAQEDISKCLRIEQNIHYEFLSNQERAVDYYDSFFREHFERLFQIYGLNVYEWSPEGSILLLDEISSGRENTIALNRLRQKLNEGLEQPIEIVELLGRPLVGLSLICVPHYVWPGLLKSYINMFESLVNKIIEFAKTNPNSLVPTCSLEVIGNAERAMSYLFNGDQSKLGLRAITSGSDDSILNWLTHFNFPLFSMDSYDFTDLPTIRCETWPRGSEGTFETILFPAH